MRTFTRFKVGDTVKIQPHILAMWLSFDSLSENRATEFEVVCVKADQFPHAYDEICTNANCIHAWAHPDQLWLNNGKLVSAIYFDPECTKYQPAKAGQP